MYLQTAQSKQNKQSLVLIIIVLCNNMRNLKFKSPIFHCRQSMSWKVSENEEIRFNGAKWSRSSLTNDTARSKGHILCCDWWILIHFVGFCFSQSTETAQPKGPILCCDWWILIHFVIRFLFFTVH